MSRKGIFTEDNLALILNAKIEEEVKKEVLEDFQWIRDYLKDYELEYELLEVNHNNYSRYRSFLLGLHEEHSQKRSQSKSQSNSQAEVGKVEDIETFEPAHTKKQPVVGTSGGNVPTKQEPQKSKPLSNEVEELDIEDFGGQQNVPVKYVAKQPSFQETSSKPKIQNAVVEDVETIYEEPEPAKAKVQKVDDEFFDDWGEVHNSPNPSVVKETSKTSKPASEVYKPQDSNTKPKGPQTLPKSQPTVVNNAVPKDEIIQKSADTYQPSNQGSKSQGKMPDIGAHESYESNGMVMKSPDIEHVYQNGSKREKVSFAPLPADSHQPEVVKINKIEEYRPVEGGKEKDFFASYNDPKMANHLNTLKVTPGIGVQEEIQQNWPQLANNPVINIISQLQPKKLPASSTLITSALIQNMIPGDRPSPFGGNSLRPNQPKTFQVSSSFLKLNSDYYYKSDLVSPQEFNKAPLPVLGLLKQKAVADLGSQMGGNFGEIATNQPFKSIILNPTELAHSKPMQEKEKTQSKQIKIELDDPNAHVPLQKSKLNASSMGDQSPFGRSRFVPLTEAEKKPIQFKPINISQGKKLLTSTVMGTGNPEAEENHRVFVNHYLEAISKCECMAEPRYQQRLGFMTNFFRRVTDPSDIRIQKISPLMRKFDSLMTKFEQEKNISEVCDEICKIENNWQCHTSNDSLQDKEKKRLWQLAEDNVKNEIQKTTLASHITFAKNNENFAVSATEQAEETNLPLSYILRHSNLNLVENEKVKEYIKVQTATTGAHRMTSISAEGPTALVNDNNFLITFNFGAPKHVFKYKRCLVNCVLTVFNRTGTLLDDLKLSISSKLGGNYFTWVRTASSSDRSAPGRALGNPEAGFYLAPHESLTMQYVAGLNTFDFDELNMVFEHRADGRRNFVNLLLPCTFADLIYFSPLMTSHALIEFFNNGHKLITEITMHGDKKRLSKLQGICIQEGIDCPVNMITWGGVAIIGHEDSRWGVLIMTPEMEEESTECIMKVQVFSRQEQQKDSQLLVGQLKNWLKIHH